MDLGTGSAVTRNVSASGMYFEADMPYTIGNEIRFAVDLETPEGRSVLRCRGEILRVRPQNGKMGMAVKIVESVLEDVR